MKKQILAVIFALVMSVFINAGQIHAQSQGFRIDVPFDFSANDKAFPAGTYIVNPVTDNRIMWRIESAHQNPAALLMAGSLSGANESGNVLLTFRRYGDRHFLISFKTSSYQVKLPTSSSEKEFRRTEIDVAKSDAVTIEIKESRDRSSDDK